MEKQRPALTLDREARDIDARPLSLTSRDLAIFRLLDPEYGFHYLPSHWIHAFVGGDPLRLAKRLGRLSRKPHDYLVRRQDWYKHAVYSRTVKSDRHLGEHRSRTRDPYAHRLLEDMVQASIALGGRADPRLAFAPWPDLAATGKIPSATLDAANPRALPVASGTLIPDGWPFAIRHGERWRFILGKEIDRATEPLVSGHARRSIRNKFERYAECFAHRVYATHYGFPNAVVLFATTSPARMTHMMDLCSEAIGPCSYLLFAHTTDWALAPRFPSPNGEMLGPYQRVGHPPCHLANFGDP